MIKNLRLLGAAVVLASLFTGCESDSSSSRVQEKSAVYGTLKPWQKKYIDTGVVATGFTPDMVYMSVGNPSTKQPAPDGETWIYRNYYPSVAASKMQYKLSSESSMGHSGIAGGVLMENDGAGGTRPVGSGPTRAGPSISTTGGPQGGSMEPADLQSYTLTIVFTKGVVSKLNLDPQ